MKKIHQDIKENCPDVIIGDEVIITFNKKGEVISKTRNGKKEI